MIKLKIKAFIIHFFCSLFILTIVYAFVRFNWYPGAFYDMEKPWVGMKLIFIVDLILGPLLTFIVVNPNKSSKERCIDIGVIISLQLSGLVWGAIQVYQEKPAAIVFWEERFFVVKLGDFKRYNTNIDNLALFSSKKPPIIYAKYPTDKETKNRLKIELMENNRLPYTLDFLYESVESNNPVIELSKKKHAEWLKNSCKDCYLLHGKYEKGSINLLNGNVELLKE